MPIERDKERDFKNELINFRDDCGELFFICEKNHTTRFGYEDNDVYCKECGECYGLLDSRIHIDKIYAVYSFLERKNGG